jgi:serine/threonine-protein kinase
MIQEGAVLAGKYRVERLLGAGGMGYVVAAIHEQLDQRVAVKLLVPELCEDKDAVLRFLREARAAVRIQSEHVARVLDVDELETGAPYMVMEFLSGHDLAHVLFEEDQLESRTAIDYVLQACEAVAEAHSLGIIHRDLKPANLFLTHRPDGSPLVKVLDFGISKAISPDSGSQGKSLTAPQSLLGSPAYMSPEQVRRPKAVDTRTDIWSFGAILYELLTGELPFRGDTALSVLAAVVSDPVPSLRERRPDISPDLEAVVFKCLEKDPDARYQTVADFAQALAPHAPPSSLFSISRISGILRSSSRPEGQVSTTLRSLSGELGHADTELTQSDESLLGAATAKQTHTDFGASQSISKRSRRLTLAAIAVLVAATGGALFAFVRPTTGASSPDAASSAATHAAAVTPAPPPPLAAVDRAPARADAGEPKVTPSEKAAQKAPRPTSAQASAPRAGGAKPAPRASATAATAAPDPALGDPLEGRR